MIQPDHPFLKEVVQVYKISNIFSFIIHSLFELSKNLDEMFWGSRLERLAWLLQKQKKEESSRIRI
ncbi:hypothetical protein BFO01nite_18640 [Brevibacillus formosus]|uniref:Uncharacterized protein n=1 Tax=Brevibacillus formosus TaxID=54913 RepID=A0ABQ0T386_9BACL|nr:hypothetical protein BFO01nite_18640 [Brevibacillus formosus]